MSTPKPAAGQFIGRLNTNYGLISAQPEFSRPAVGLMVLRLKIGLFSGLGLPLLMFIYKILIERPFQVIYSEALSALANMMLNVIMR